MVRKYLTSYYHSLLPILAYLFFTARTLGFTVKLDHSPLTLYLLGSWLICYPLVADTLQRFRPERFLARRPAIQLHDQDLRSHDRGSNWRVPHTKVSLLAAKDVDAPATIGRWLFLQIAILGLILIAPELLLGKLLWQRGIH
ncbi:hypothetical protein [Levilactobacillus tongjiangensis]|uniref:Uncharacterized protein n=1 Tax=Levilactobacillus tongjiangensis TaxID=2486023 RepID=A0ABW1SV25_9LACO|nr:hypothetical protein [Levilactobacillus tongjiangensis]